MEKTESASWTRTRARIASHRRNHPDVEPPESLYADHAAARLEDYIRKTLDAAPPLSTAQRHHLSSLLRAVDAGGGAA